LCDGWLRSQQANSDDHLVFLFVYDSYIIYISKFVCFLQGLLDFTDFNPDPHSLETKVQGGQVKCIPTWILITHKWIIIFQLSFDIKVSKLH
jgi:hypothetical protein